ncbi:class I SAM-dependent methyltransferase [Mycobacterium neglectum]|uniref:class I SAM-dependent methyltransferase n=1 Tax=Mycobacterium neglectum TaxID=242737 RepID=UPI003CCB894D
MNEIVKECRLCGSTGPHQTIAVREMQFGTQELFQYYCCAVCDTLQIVDLLESEELERHYPIDYYSYNVSTRPRIRRWLATQQDRFELQMGGRLVGAVIAAVPHSIRTVIGTHDASGDVVRMLGQLSLERDARILDVGCGGGALLDRLARVGFNNLFGADPLLAGDGETPEGVPLMKRYMSDVPGEFDLIMFNHSLEHVPDPVATIKAAYEKLADGGICLVRLPTTSSEAWEIYGADWISADAPRHTVIPSRSGMALAAETVGLRVEKTFDDSTFLQFIGSEAYRHDIALTDPRFLPKVLRMFGWKKIWNWQRRAERLNGQGRGDCAGFVLRAK